jgi:uncharacterized protein (TIGR02231 family)
VVFYPDEARLTVARRVRPVTLPSGNQVLLIALPVGAAPESFSLSVDGAPAQGYYWPDEDERDKLLALCPDKAASSHALLPENESSPERKALLDALVPLAEDSARKEGELAAAEARLALWRKSLEEYGRSDKGRFPPADDAAKLDAAYAEHYPEIYTGLENRRRALEDARRSLRKAEKALRDHDQLRDGPLAVVPLEGMVVGQSAAGAEASVDYAFSLPASCEIGYRLDARPDAGQFKLDQDATLRQNSGFAWNGVNLYVSTVRRDKELRPAGIRPWVVRLVKKEAEGANALGFRQREVAPAPMMAQQFASDSVSQVARKAVPPAAAQEERATFRVWKLGKRSIAAGTPVTLSLSTEILPASFCYTLRPSLSPRGFLTAEIALPKVLELPPGLARFSVDGAVMGSQRFSFNGDKGEIFFGSDPQITATMRDLQKTAGEQGFFNKEETRSWHWEITLRNGRQRTVQVVVEDAAPTTDAEDVNIIAQSTPRPEEVVNEARKGGAHIFRWKATLNPGTPMTIDHQIRLVAPITPDRELAPGR